jgi:hypothetical protein
MSAYSLDVLIRKWGRGELTVEQVLGQALLHIQDLKDTVMTLEYRTYHRSDETEQDVPEDHS